MKLTGKVIVPLHAWPLFRLGITGDNRVTLWVLKGGNLNVFLPSLLNGVKVCFIKCLSVTSFELKIFWRWIWTVNLFYSRYLVLFSAAWKLDPSFSILLWSVILIIFMAENLEAVCLQLRTWTTICRLFYSHNSIIYVNF